MNAKSSLGASINHFVDNEYGLGEDVQYIDSTGASHDTRLVKEYREADVKSREISDNEISNKDMFLIKLSFEPKKNDKVVKNGKTHFVKEFEEVTSETYRVYVTSGAQYVPGGIKRIMA